VLDGTGTQVATLDLRWFANETDDDIEITRDRLNAILLSAIPGDVEFRFETSIASIGEGSRGVDVACTDGVQGRYHLVVGADGLHSNVRKLAFGPEKDYVRHFGYYVALVDLQTDGDWQRGRLIVTGLAI